MPTLASESRDLHGPVVRLHSFKVPVRSQSSFLAEFDALLEAAACARGQLGHETFLGGRNPRHIVLVTAWSSKRACEAFFAAAESVAARRRLVFRYLEVAEFLRPRGSLRGLSLSTARAMP